MSNMHTPVVRDTGKRLLVIGGTSDIGRAIGDAYAAKGWRVAFAARNVEAATRNAEDIQTRRGADQVPVYPLDILDTGSFDGFIDSLGDLPDTIVCVVGMLGDQPRAQDDPDHATAIMRTNFEGPALLLEQLAGRCATRGHGLIVGVSSVAGDRGRASNYVYGASKAGFSAYLSGLRNRFGQTDVRIVTVKPGFVNTAMTAGMNLPKALTASPEAVAQRILDLQTNKANVVYTFRVWRLIMGIICALPEPIFKRLKL